VEFLGVPDRPDALDPVAGDVERAHRHGDAVSLSDQAGLAVDRALQDRQVGCRAGDIDAGARDLFAALDRAEHGGGEAAAVGDRGGVGVEEADEGVDVLGFPCLLEGSDGQPSAINRLLVLNAEPHPGRGTVLLLREAIGF
jgi:hypothetical protein